MTQPRPPLRPGVCPRCYQTVTAKMPRVLTTEGAYHHRCYMHVRQPRRQKAGSPAISPGANGTAPPGRDRLPRLLERLAQAVVAVILIGTALILLGHALP